MIAFGPVASMVPVRIPDGRWMIESPCTKVCTLDARSRVCLGCGRTIEEIAGWAAMTASERARIMVELPARKTGQPAAAGATG